MSVSAAPPAIDPTTACATDFSVLRVQGDPNAVVVVATYLPLPLQGAITAYGREASWTGSIERAALVDFKGEPQASVVVRAPSPIEAIEFTPSWASCSFRAGTRSWNGYDDERSLDRPIVTVANPQPLAPPACANPYVPASVKSAIEPVSPPGAEGIARVAVSLDSHGAVLKTRVITAPGPREGRASEVAAQYSTYSGAIFRCEPIGGGYVFSVGFAH